MEQTTVSTGAVAQEPRPVDQTSETYIRNARYLQVIEAQVGRTMPRELIPDMAMSETDLNKMYFGWLATGVAVAESTPYTFTSDELEMFKHTLAQKGSTAYRTAEQNLVTHLAEAASFQTRAQEQLRHAADYREKLMLMDTTQAIDLTAEIQKIVEGGWYRYEAMMTRDHNANYGRGNDMAMFFTTPMVICSQTIDGVTTNVVMGKYKIEYKPKRNSIKVRPYENNIEVNGYYHPHIGTGNDVCWGNAAATYSNCMNTGTPSQAFRALQVILQQYNSESPYQELRRFKTRREEVDRRQDVTPSGDGSVPDTGIGSIIIFDSHRYRVSDTARWTTGLEFEDTYDIHNVIDSDIQGFDDAATEDDDGNDIGGGSVVVWERLRDGTGQASGYYYVRTHSSNDLGFDMTRIYI